MGASWISRTMPGTLTQAQVKSEFEDWQAEDRHENGHSYSGGFGMAPGVVFESRSFPTAGDANEWLADNRQKWDAAIAVKAERDFAAGSGPVWVIGAWCAS